MIVTRLNPLLEALEGGAAVNRVLLADTARGPKIERIKELCRQNRVAFQFVPAAAIARRAGARHQGVFAETAPVCFYDLEEVLSAPAPGNPLFLILDGVEDAGNLGAIVRSAAAAAVSAIITPALHSAPVNETTLTASAGALRLVKIVKATNLGRCVERLKEANVWVAGSDRHAETAYTAFDFRPPTAVILGGEARGISPLLKKKADALISIPLAVGVESLNVAAAAAVILFEALRQRGNRPSGR